MFFIDSFKLNESFKVPSGWLVVFVVGCFALCECHPHYVSYANNNLNHVVLCILNIFSFSISNIVVVYETILSTLVIFFFNHKVCFMYFVEWGHKLGGTFFGSFYHVPLNKSWFPSQPSVTKGSLFKIGGGWIILILTFESPVS